MSSLELLKDSRWTSEQHSLRCKSISSSSKNDFMKLFQRYTLLFFEITAIISFSFNFEFLWIKMSFVTSTKLPTFQDLFKISNFQSIILLHK